MRARATFADRAFLLRRTPLGEDEEIVTLFTEAHGLLRVVTRRQRPTTHRARAEHAKVLEPFHTLSVDLHEGRGELGRLQASSLERPRMAIGGSEHTLDVAGSACRWTRALLPPQVAEPQLFAAMEQLFDALDALDALDSRDAGRVDAAACAFAFALLVAVGAAPEVDRCVVCGRERPRGRAGVLDARKGGLVCAHCRDERLDPRAPIVETIAGVVLDHFVAIEPDFPGLSALHGWLGAMIGARVAAVTAAPERT